MVRHVRALTLAIALVALASDRALAQTGWLDSADTGGGHGWAYDCSNGGPTTVQILVDGKLSSSVSADRPRPDLVAAGAAPDANHGFVYSLPTLPAGAHRIDAYALDGRGASVPLLGTGKTVVALGTGAGGPAVGWLDSASATGGAGWAYVPAIGGAPATVQILVDGQLATSVTANVPRPDLVVAGAAPDPGHGFVFSLSGLAAGTHRIDASIVCPGGGPGASLLGSPQTIRVAAAPTQPCGFIDRVGGGTANGWFYDPAFPAGGAAVQVFANLPASSGGTIVGSGVAADDRPDVATALGIPGGRFGFTLQLPPGYDTSFVNLFFYGAPLGGSLTDLSGSPVTSQGTRLSNANSPQPLSSNAGWVQLDQQYVARAAQGHAPVVFFGDSITYLMAQGTLSDGLTYGAAHWNQSFGPAGAVDFGIGGDQTQQVIARLQGGELAPSLDPDAVVILIGTNNVPTGDSPQDIAQAITTIVRLVLASAPRARVLLLDILPRGAETDPSTPGFRAKIAQVNALLAPLADGQRVFGLDAGPLFMAADGTIRTDLFVQEGAAIDLHLNEAGYGALLGAIHDSLSQIVPGSVP